MNHYLLAGFGSLTVLGNGVFVIAAFIIADSFGSFILSDMIYGLGNFKGIYLIMSMVGFVVSILISIRSFDMYFLERSFTKDKNLGVWHP